MGSISGSLIFKGRLHGHFKFKLCMHLRSFKNDSVLHPSAPPGKPFPNNLSLEGELNAFATKVDIFSHLTHNITRTTVNSKFNYTMLIIHLCTNYVVIEYTHVVIESTSYSKSFLIKTKCKM